MTAEIIASTPDATKVVARAAWVCTHAGWPADHDMHPDRSGPLVRRVLASGHTSVLEHASFTFAIDGISRACSHQLVRQAGWCRTQPASGEAKAFPTVTPSERVACRRELAVGHGPDAVAETREPGNPDGFVLRTPWF